MCEGAIERRGEMKKDPIENERYAISGLPHAHRCWHAAFFALLFAIFPRSLILIDIFFKLMFDFFKDKFLIKI